MNTTNRTHVPDCKKKVIPPHHWTALNQMQGKKEGSLWHYRSWNHHFGALCQSADMGPRSLALSELCKPSRSHSHCNLALGAVEGHACCQSSGSPSATLPWIWKWNGEQVALKTLGQHTEELGCKKKMIHWNVAKVYAVIFESINSSRDKLLYNRFQLFSDGNIFVQKTCSCPH